MKLEKISSLIAALVFGAFTILVVLGLEFPSSYSDFIVGSSTWIAGNKTQDLIVWPIFIIIAYSSFVCFTKLHLSLSNNYGEEVSSRLSNQIILWSLPFFASIASLLFGRAFDYYSIILPMLAMLFISLAIFASRNSKVIIDPDFFSGLFLTIVLISIIPISLAVLVSRFSKKFIYLIDTSTLINTSYFLLSFTFILFIISIYKIKSILVEIFPKIILISQLFLPFFYITLFPAKLLQPSGNLIKYNTTIYLKIFIISLIVFSLYDVIRRFLAYKTSSQWKLLFSPFAIYSLVILLKVGNTLEPQISTDDYHFGEQLLGWWSLTKGYIPYVDLLPAHGFVDDYLTSFFSSIFYNGTAASLTEASRITFAVLGLIAYLSIIKFSKNILFGFIILMLMGGKLTSLFFVPFICLWLSSSLKKESDKWLGVWILTVPLIILGTPPQGLLLVIAFSSLMFMQIWKQISNNSSYKYILFSLFILSFLFIFTPLSLMLFNAIRYVLENGVINQVAYGVSWDLSWNKSQKSGLMFEIVRMSWVLIPLLCLYIIEKEWRNFKNTSSSFYPALIFLIFILLLIPYTMGRIDPGGPSRPGLTSIFSWALLFPILLIGFIHKDFRPLIMVIFIFTSSLLGFSTTTFGNILSSIKPAIETSELTNAPISGLNNIGIARIEPIHWERIKRLNALLNTNLKSDETYLDLTSRNANYFYLNRLPLIPVTAPYNLVNENEQKRAIDSLKILPKFVLLQADNIIHDGGGLSLRNPHIYRFIIDNYIPKYERGFITGYKNNFSLDNNKIINAEVKKLTNSTEKTSLEQQETSIILSDPVLVTMLKIGDQLRFNVNEIRFISKISIETNTVWFKGKPVFLSNDESIISVDILVTPQIIQEYYASLFQRSFSTSNFQKIPFAWGKSVKTLNKRMTLVQNLDQINPQVLHLAANNNQYQVNGIDPNLIFNLNNVNVSGKSAGLLKFDFECIQKNEDPKLQVFWWGDERSQPFESSSVIFSGDTGTLIVPLDASPWWYTLRKIKGIRIDLQNPNACSAITVTKIGLYQRS